jgi:Type II restriction endonuclease, TdeIII
MLEGLAIAITKLSYKVERRVEGTLSSEQTNEIARILEAYRRRAKRPEVKDYVGLISMRGGGAEVARHESDYYLQDWDIGHHYLVELKIGGDLDNKKARSEKQAVLEQYAILCNSLGSADKVSIHFATAYNRFGEGAPWHQERVRQFFADEELLIGSDFWNFVCKSDAEYEVVLDEHKRNASSIVDALTRVKVAYLG